MPKSDVTHQHFFLMTIFPFSDILNTVLLTLKKHIQHSGGGVSEIALLLFEAITQEGRRSIGFSSFWQRMLT